MFQPMYNTKPTECSSHKRRLQFQAVHALNTAKHLEAHNDTGADNVASRKSLLAVLFEPKGIIDTRELKIPRVKSWVWGSWDVDADHPRLDGGANS